MASFPFNSVLVTGADGFIGRHLCKSLVEKGVEVKGIAGGDSSVSGVKTLKADISDLEKISKFCKGSDAVFHLAGISDIPSSEKNPFENAKINATGTLTMLEAASKCGVEKFVFPSTAHVYGNAELLPVSENHPLSPVSFYGLHKLFSEQYCDFYFRKGFSGVVVARLFNVFGPGQTGRVVSDFIEQAKNSQKITVKGNGSDSKDFIYVDDAVNGLLLLLEKGKGGEAYNLGSGTETRMGELAEIVARTAEKKGFGSKKAVYSSSEKDAKRIFADIGKIRKLGFNPSQISEKTIEKCF